MRETAQVWLLAREGQGRASVGRTGRQAGRGRSAGRGGESLLCSHSTTMLTSAVGRGLAPWLNHACPAVSKSSPPPRMGMRIAGSAAAIPMRIRERSMPGSGSPAQPTLVAALASMRCPACLVQALYLPVSYFTAPAMLHNMGQALAWVALARACKQGRWGAGSGCQGQAAVCPPLLWAMQVCARAAGWHQRASIMNP